ncbi:MAG: TolC family protein [Thermotogae bacterium]|nr:TolC family protein [Thermotogota bacterium]
MIWLFSLTLTEKKAIEIGLKNFPLLAADSMDILSEGMQVREIGSALWPKVDFQFGYAYNSYVSEMVMASPVRWKFIEIPPGSGQGIAYPDSFVVDTFEFGKKHNFRFSLTLSRVLWSWGRMERGYLLQRRLFKSRWKDYESRKLAHEYRIRKLYTIALLLKEVVAVAETSLKFSEENLKLVREAYINGRVSRIDFLRAKVSYEEAVYNLEDTQKSYSTVLHNLKLLIGIPDTLSVTLIDTLSLPEEEPDTSLNRADIEYIKEQAHILKEMAKEELKSFLPMVVGSISYNYQRPLGFEDKWGSNWMANLGVTWTLFNGLKPYNTYKRYAYRSEALERRAAFLEMSAKTDLTNALHEYRSARRRVKASAASLSMAKEAHRLAREAYRNGRISYTDFKQTELQYLRALINYKRAITDARTYYLKALYLRRTSIE